MEDLDNLLTVENLRKTYGGARAVEHVAFGVRAGEVVGLLGPNGAGKSTTLHCITGIIEPSGGSVSLCNMPADDPRAKDMFGLLPDDLPLPASLRASEVLALHRKLRPRFDQELADELLGLVGLSNELTKPVGDYSHGMKRKLHLVAALAHHPRLLILDEPLRGLDPEAAILIRTMMETFKEQGGGVLFATHDLLAAEHFCDRVVIMADGSAIASGAPDELMKRSNTISLEQFFVQVTGLIGRIAESEETVRHLSLAGASGGNTESREGSVT